MTGVTDMSDPIDQFKKIEEELPFVAITDDSDLHNQLNFFLSVCKNNLNDCNDVKVIFPMFYKLNDWQEFSTEFINPKIYLSRYQDGFNDLINEQLNISKQNIEYSFSRNLINIQNNGSNKFRYNIIISKGDSDEFTEENFTYIFKFKDLIKKENSIFESTLEIHTIINRTIDNGVQYKSPIFQFNNNDFLKAMLTPSHIHTIYLKDNLKIYYIFSNCVSKYEKNFSLISTYGLGGIFVLMVDTYGAEKEKEKELIKVLERITDKVANRIVNYFHKSLITLHATRAAISQVMARNMSHNIGSHVISKFKDEDKISNFKGNEQYTPLENYANNDYFKLYIANFNEYLKDRMDFLADIASTDPVMESSLSFVSDILKRFDQNPILLNRISGVDSNVKYGLRVRRCSGNEWKDIIGKGDGFSALHGKDFPISIPNDILGTQAWYIFLENIIRNIYKHAKPEKNFTICMDFKDSESDASFYEVSVYDTLCKESNHIEEKVKSRNLEIDKKILSENKLREGALGTIEMKVCAAFIRKLPIRSIEEEVYRINNENGNNINSEQGKTTNKVKPSNTILCAFKHKLIKADWPQNCKNNGEKCSSTDCYTLGYKFFLSKPKEVLVVTTNHSDFKISENGTEINLPENGILVKTPDEIKNDIFPHQFLYFLGDTIDISDNKSQLPKRIIHSYNKDEIITNEGKQGFISSLWKAYFNYFLINNFNKEHKSIIINFKDSKFYNININSDTITCNELINIENNINDFYGICLFDHTNNYLTWSGKMSYKYYDIYWSASLMNRYVQKLDVITALGYLESVKQKIVVIDERIQQNIVKENRKVEEVSLYEFYKNLKVFIPYWSEKNNCNNDVNLNADILEEHLLTKFISKHTDADYYVMHLGLIERLIAGDKTKQIVSDKIDSLFNCHRHKLVLTSGRGSPQTVPDDISYLPITVLQYALETVRDKFYLTRALFNSRKIQHYGNN